MSIVPVSSLSASDLSMLGNNLQPRCRGVARASRRLLGAVNRSLAAHGEVVAALHRPPPPRTAVFAPPQPCRR